MFSLIAVPHAAVYPTHAKVVGLAVVTAASITTPAQFAAQKWICVLVVPLALAAAVYALIDTSKFQGYSSEERMPLSHWRGGSFGLVDFSALLDAPRLYTFYVVRTFLSILINISSVLLVLIDTVCLQVRIRRLEGTAKSLVRVFCNVIRFRASTCSIS